MDVVKKDSSESLPSLIRFANQVAGFDMIDKDNNLDTHHQPTGIQIFSPSARVTTKSVASQSQSGLSRSQRMNSVSISMPSSPHDIHLQSSNKVNFSDKIETIFNNDNVNCSMSENHSNKQAKFYSQPIPGSAFDEVRNDHPDFAPRNPRINKLKDRRFDSFKTLSGKLERQLSHLRGKSHETGQEATGLQNVKLNNLPVDRYFDALEGPELDRLRASEEIILPEDKKWPFLLRYPITSFGICLGLSSQAILWKTLATSASMKFLHVSLNVNLILWSISVAVMAIVSLIYSLKVVFYFEAVRREYYHPIRVNFFFAPLISLLFLALGVPQSIAQNLHTVLWYILMTPVLCLELKIYGQWMSGGQRRLSKVANPSNHLSVVGNFVGALLGASMGLKDGPLFFFSVGLAHYIVLFVTLYQRLPTNETLPKELHPVFFLFVAAPSVASMAWAKLQGSFDYGSRIAYFIGLFLYSSLAVRINFFRGFRFSLAWWAYTFPMTAASIATIRYSNEVTNTVTKSLSVILCVIATLVVAALLITTIVHAFVLHDLFPNDIGIAISKRRPKTTRKWFHRRTGSSDARDIESYLKFADSEAKDQESLTLPITTKGVCSTSETSS